MTNSYIPYYGAYSFMDVQAIFKGPGTEGLNLGGAGGAGSIQVAGPNSGSAEEGCTITLGEETNTQTIGADGSVMNSLHASRAGTATFRLLKTSPVNRALMIIYNYQRQQSSLWARNLITIEDLGRHDKYTLQGCAFVRFPTNAYAKVGNTIEWEFHVSLCYGMFGDPYELNVAGTSVAMSGTPQPYFGGFDNYIGAFGRGPVSLTRLPPGRIKDELSMVGRGG